MEKDVMNPVRIKRRNTGGRQKVLIVINKNKKFSIYDTRCKDLLDEPDGCWIPNTTNLEIHNHIQNNSR